MNSYQYGIVHVEDDPLWRQFVHMAVDTISFVTFLGHANTVSDGLSLTSDLKPALLILDLNRPLKNAVF
jgi:response regulator of citrate/malate metabolism